MSSSPSVPDTAPYALDPTRLAFVMWLVTGAMFMEILDGTIITTALPAMARSFGTTAVALNIGVSGYLLALGVFIPASSWVADRYGARKVFALAIALFTLTSVLCGLAQGLAQFFALRVVQGMAGAMMVPVGRLVVMKYTPKEKLMAALSALIWPALIAPVLGPPIGGFITTHAGWRWIFYLNLPLGIAALIATLLWVPDARGPRQRFDIPGFLLTGTATFALLLGLEWIVEAPGVSAAALIVVGVVLAWAAVRHLRRATDPLMDLTSLRIPTFRASLRGGSLFRMGIGSAPFLLPLMFQVGFGFDAFHSGLLVLAVFVGNIAMKTVTTPLLRRFGYRTILIWNGVLCALSLAACALLQANTHVAITVAVLFVGGLTRSMQFTAAGTLAFADVPKPQMSHANSLSNTIGQVGMAAGITLAALGVRAGHALAKPSGQADAVFPFHVAFVLVAVICLAGVVDVFRLPRGAGDAFVAKRG